MRKKIGLVIQGPLTSIGKSGEQLRLTLEELNARGGAIHYDCRPNIQRIINEFGSLFDYIVVSTWDNEIMPGESFPGAKLISVPDPGGIKRAKYHYKDNNKFRQYESTLNGLKELEKSGVDYAVKIRADIYLDLQKLTKSFFTSIEKNDNPKAIYAPVIHKPTFLLHDLYFAARLKTLKDFCEAILAYDRFEFISSAHMEVILKHTHVQYKRVINVPDWAYFPMSPLLGINSSTRQIFDYMLENIYFPLDPDIFRGTHWRGSRFPGEHVEGLLEVKNPSLRKFYIPGLISTDWERYLHFRRQVTRKKITFMDKIVIKIGKLGWRLWNLVRKVARMRMIKT